jgi:hypothetical protein
MNIRNCIRRNNNRKSVLLTIRVTPEISRRLKNRNLSPTGIFYEALRDLKVINGGNQDDSGSHE